MARGNRMWNLKPEERVRAYLQKAQDSLADDNPSRAYDMLEKARDDAENLGHGNEIRRLALDIAYAAQVCELGQPDCEKSTAWVSSKLKNMAERYPEVPEEKMTEVIADEGQGSGE